MTAAAKRILVAEDNSAFAAVIRFSFERAGYHVTVACNGREAWDHFQRERFDLVVTDQQMPEMTGCELAARIRQSEDHSQIPVILLTAKRWELELPRLTEELGVTSVFPKPFSPRKLVRAVEDCFAALS